MVQDSQSVSHCTRSTPLWLEQSRNLNWGPVLQASLIRAPATSGLVGKGLV